MRFRALSVAVVVLLGVVSASDGQDILGRTMRVTSPARITLYPDPKRIPLATLEPGDPVTVLEEKGDWLKVTFGTRGERTGYMRREHLAVRPVAPQPTATATVAPPAATTQNLSPAAPSPSATRPAPPTPPMAAPPTAPAVAPTPPTPAPTVAAAEPVAASPSVPPAVAAPAAVAPALAPPTVAASTNRVEARGVRPMAEGTATSAQYRDLEKHVQIGLRAKGRMTGLDLQDTGQQFFAAMTAGGRGATASEGFSLRVYTPLAWVQQVASNAAKEYRPFTVQDVDDETLEPVVRIIAFPDTPNTVTASGMVGTSSVQHVVLRDESRRTVVQPTFKEPFTEEAANAMGGKAVFNGLRLKFALSDIRELRGPNGDREFFITVIGTSGEEKNFKVKRKHFDDLP